MESVESAVCRAREGDMNAFGWLVERFQDMAVGFAYSILRDFQLAEDAAQEAFWEAFRTLHSLREPAAFPGWFRPIVFKHCDRLTRRKQVVTIPLHEAFVNATQSNPADRLEQLEKRDKILEAIQSLPGRQRAATTLYYMSGYTCREVGEFLGLPVATVKKSLHSARGKLRELLVDLVAESLRERRPSRNQDFAARVMEVLQASRRGDTTAIRDFLERDPRLARGRDSMGNTPIVLASNSGHEEVVQMLLAHGARIGFHEAAAMGATDRVLELLEQDATLLDSYSEEGFSATCLAAHFGHSETLEFLLKRGGDPNRMSRHPLGVAPLHAALFGRHPGTASILVRNGADVSLARGGKGWPRAGWTALHYAAAFGYTALVQTLLDAGSDPSVKDEAGRTPIDVAAECGRDDIVALLAGPFPRARDESSH